MATIAHVRTVTYRRERRIRSLQASVASPAPTTLCGAPITDRDFTIGSARRAAAAGVDPMFNLCHECLRRLS